MHYFGGPMKSIYQNDVLRQNKMEVAAIFEKRSPNALADQIYFSSMRLPTSPSSWSFIHHHVHSFLNH
jgi:hypothetical protein